MSDDEYGEIEEDIWDEAFTQASQTLPSHSPHQRKRRRISTDDEFEDDDVHVGQRKQSRGPNDDEAEANENKKRKYKVHYGAEGVPEAVIVGATQADGMPDSSPYRIRGPIYRKPRPEPEPEPVPEPKQAPLAAIFSRPTNTQKRINPPVQMNDFSKELEDLPSDAFSPSPPQERRPLASRSIALTPSRTQRLVAPQTGLRQTTLFGGRAPDEIPSASQAKKVHNYLVDKVPEPPTHHKLDTEAIQTWVYPINLGTIREYQYSIVYNGLFNNLLVALPTGLGKTFIAATIMLNYFRWTKDSQIVFVAPTKPLVSQQVKACFEIAGIPRSATTMLTGDQSPALRAEEWSEKRVFFMTPQTIDNDLKTGIADPKKIVLLVVDEAHRATGNYAYAKVVQFIRRFNKSFRILALTATPGSTVEAVQEVIDNLEIAKVEIRTEESIDIKQYVHQRIIDEILIDPSDEIVMVKELLSKALQPLMTLLCSQNCYYNKDPMSLTQFGMVQARKQWMGSPAGRSANMGLKGMINALFTVLTSVAHSIKLLNFHGIGPFFSNIKDFRSSVEDGKGGKYRNQIVNNPDFKKMMDRIQGWINKDGFIGHPKLTHLCDTVLNHFLDAGEGLHGDDAPPSSTRIIVFAEYRDSAEDITRVLNRHGPMIRASVFVGQSDSKRSDGMNQMKQLETIRKFKAGIINVIVATSIGEEGLDIGEVDLIVCYDSSSSPIRMLQRMGRTGRKRAGRIVLLLMRGKEEDSYKKSKDNYQQMQGMISSGARFTFRHDLSARIIPRDVKPVVDKCIIEIPPENTQDDSLPEPKRRAKPKKKPPKKFHMPDGVETGFRKASKLDGDGNSLAAFGITRKPSELNKDELAPVPLIESVLLTPKETAELYRRFLKVPDDASKEVDIVSMNSQTITQRSLTKTSKIPHGKYTKRCVGLFKTLSQSQRFEDRNIKPYGDVPPSDFGSPPDMPFEADLKKKISAVSRSPIMPPKVPKPPKIKSRADKSATVKKKPPPRRRQALANDDDDDDSDDSMVSKTRESQLTQPPADSEEEGPGERVDRTSDMDDLQASEDSDIGSLEDFIDPTQAQTQAHASSGTYTSSPLGTSSTMKHSNSNSTSNFNTHSNPNLTQKPYFEMTKFTSTQDTEDGDEVLPALEDLVGGFDKGKRKEKTKGKGMGNSTPRATPNMFLKRNANTYGKGDLKNRKRRVVVDSDSDE